MRDIHIALIHWPVLDRSGQQVVTNVTHFDVHDIARAAKTYGVSKYYIVNRLQEQLMYVSRILMHWKIEKGAKYNPKRREALSMVEPVETLEKLLSSYEQKPYVVATAARDLDGVKNVTFPELRGWIEQEDDRPLLLLFGTGSGLHDHVLQNCDALLEPIRGGKGSQFRHLSVRSAVSIILDRLLSV